MSHYRAIDVSALRPVVPADLAVPVLQWVNIADLVIDDRYQRPLGKTNWTAIARIAAAFDWARFSAVQVAAIAGGAYAVIDGQHRVHAAALCGFTSVPALCVVMPPAAQAQAFVWINAQSIRLSGLQIYRAALAGGEDWAVQVDDCVARAGCVMRHAKPSFKDRKPREVYAISMMKRYVQAGQSDAVTAALAALAAFDAQGRVPLWGDAVLAPWIDAVAANPLHLRADLAAVLRRTDPLRVIKAAAGVDLPGTVKARATAMFVLAIKQQLQAVAA